MPVGARRTIVLVIPTPPRYACITVGVCYFFHFLFLSIFVFVFFLVIFFSLFVSLYTGGFIAGRKQLERTWESLFDDRKEAGRSEPFDRRLIRQVFARASPEPDACARAETIVS